MKTTSIALICLGLGLAGNMAAQDIPRFEITGNYSYLQYNPSVSGLQSRAFNGGGGAFQMNFGRVLGIKGDFQGYGSTDWTVTAAAINPLAGTTAPSGTTYTTQGTMFTWLFGPTVSVHREKFTVFSEFLMGGSNSTLYGNLQETINANGGKLAAIGTQHPFTLALGGGLDLNVHKHVALRLAELDYVMTRYTNPLTQTNNQNSFRYQGGVVFRFGGE